MLSRTSSSPSPTSTAAAAGSSSATPCLFPFLHDRLGLSKAASPYRKTAAGLLQRYPEIIEPLRDGRLCLTTIGQLAKVITPANRGSWTGTAATRARSSSVTPRAERE